MPEFKCKSCSWSDSEPDSNITIENAELYTTALIVAMTKHKADTRHNLFTLDKVELNIDTWHISRTLLIALEEIAKRNND